MRNRINIFCAMCWSLTTGMQFATGHLVLSVFTLVCAFLYGIPAFYTANEADKAEKATYDKN